MTSQPTVPEPAEVRESVGQIVASPLFQTSERLCRFLQYISEETLAGRSERIKEYTIAIDVYQRPPGFDPKTDAIVRVEAGRMRTKLEQYYATAGAGITVRVALPRGSYVPLFTCVRAPVPPLQPVASKSNRGKWAAPLVTCVVVAALLPILWFWRRPASGQPQLAIAVLPFVSINGAETDRIARGMVEELTGALAQENGVLIASRSESDAFAGKIDLAAVGARLKVGAVLEGSVQTAGAGVRATFQLVTVADGFHVWSQSLDSLPGRRPEFQSRACSLIVRTMRAKFLGLKGGLHRPLTQNMEALSLYLRGAEAWATQRPSGLREGLGFYQDALQRDPGFAKAYEGIAASELYLADFERESAAEHIARAKQAAVNALRLDERLEDAHARLGNIYFRREWNFAEGEQHLKRSLILAPGQAPPTRWYSLLARLRKAYSEAQEELEYGLMANPRSEILQSELGLLHFQLGRLDEAQRQAANSAEIDPNYALTRYLMGLLHEAAGRLDDAEAEFRAGAGIGELRRYCLAGLGHVLAQRGRTKEAEQIAQQLTEASPPSLMLAGVVYAGLNQKERALSALEEGYRVHDLELPFCRLNPGLKSLQSEPRFRDLLSKMGVRSD
jgi:TolB-like protein